MKLKSTGSRNKLKLKNPSQTETGGKSSVVMDALVKHIKKSNRDDKRESKNGEGAVFDPYSAAETDLSSEQHFLLAGKGASARHAKPGNTD